MQKEIAEYLKQAIKDRKQRKITTLRLILAALKDQEIHRRTDKKNQKLTKEEIFEILAKMIKQREESVRMYEKGGRLELVDREKEEIEIIKELLPKQLNQNETENAIEDAVKSLNANTIRDIGKVMAELKKNYAGKMNFAHVAAQVRKRLENE